MDDGTRTHDDLSHSQGLYQLSYAHHKQFKLKPDELYFLITASVMPQSKNVPDRTRTCYPRLRRPVLYPDELRAPSQKKIRGRGIRTLDILLPKQTRYQAALYPEESASYCANKISSNHFYSNIITISIYF